MFHFGKTSLEKLGTCDIQLQQVARHAIETSPVDFTIVCGHRGQKEQDECFAKGLSKLKWPNGNHNATPSKAFDFAPVVNGRVDWENLEAFKTVADHILTTGDRLGISLRWGGDWNCNHIADERFVDMPHIELK